MRILKLLTAPVLAAAALAAAPADARRIAVDQNPDGSRDEFLLQGYCDLDGQDCEPVALGYSIDFGAGALDRVLVYGNGLVSFGGTAYPIAQAFQDSDDPDKSFSFDSYPGSLAGFSVPVVTPGLSTSVTSDFQGGRGDVSVFEQSGRLVRLNAVTGQFRAEFFTCFTTTDCRDPRIDYSAIFTPTTRGLRVRFDGADFPNAGYSVLPGVSVEDGDRDFLIPATFAGITPAAVPEPRAWALLIAGFGLLGAALRRRPRAAATA